MPGEVVRGTNCPHDIWSAMNRIWAGIDSGKTHHHCLVLNEGGETLLSRRVANDEPELLKLLDAVLALGDQATWAVDTADGEPALLLALPLWS